MCTRIVLFRAFVLKGFRAVFKLCHFQVVPFSIRAVFKSCCFQIVPFSIRAIFKTVFLSLFMRND